MGAGSVRAALFALAAAVPAAVFLFPWALDAVPGLVTEGGLTWEPSLWVLVAAGVALVASLVGGDKAEAALAGWGAVLAALGAVVVALDLGREPSVAGILAASLGLAVLAGAATDLPRRREEREAPFPALSWVAAAGGLALAVLALLVVPDGRLGLPPDRLTSALEFTEALAAPRGPDRALLIGEPGSVPGEARVASSGYAYQAVSAPMPTMDEAWLAEPLPGDEELAAVLAAIEQGRLVRPGAALAPFGIRWVIFLDPVTIAARFQTQLDMSPLTLAGGLSAYQSEVRSPRALVDGEAAWRFVPPGYQGRAAEGGRVVVAENADPRWGDEWKRVDWRNEASAAAGTVGFRADPPRRTMAMAAAGFAILLAAVAIWGSTRRAKPPANGSTVAEPAHAKVGDRP
jgi:hypothetical protein